VIGIVQTRGGTFCGIDAVDEISPVTDEHIEHEAYPTEHSLRHRSSSETLLMESACLRRIWALLA
jgi:hypothetical protein